MKKFSVVVFPDEDDVIDVISSSWILPQLNSDQKNTTGICRYPPRNVRGAKLINIVTKHKTPSSEWLICSCRTLGEFDDFDQAREASIRAQETSNLESTVLDAAASRRQRRKQISKEKKKKLSATKRVVKPGLPRQNIRKENSSSDESNTLDDSAGAPIPAPITAPTNLNFNLVAVDNDGDALNLQSQNEEVNDPKNGEEIAVIPAPTEINGDQLIIDISQLSTNFSTAAVVDSDKLQSVEDKLEDFIKEQRKFHEVVIQKLEIISGKLRSNNSAPLQSQNITLHGAPVLPLSCEDDLVALIDWLSTEKNQEELTEYLSLHGGENVTSVTSSILRELLTNPFATKVSFTGQGSNAVCGIKDTRLYKVIIRAVRANKGFDRSTDLEVKQATINWLRNAGDRSGGREARRKRNLTG